MIETDGRATPASTLAGRAGAVGIDMLRRAYEGYAEAAERAIGAFEASAAQVGADLRTVMGSTGETAHHVSETGLGATRATRDGMRGIGERGLAAFERQASRHRGDLRTLAQHVLVACDTNVRAGFDAAEELAGARDAASVLKIQARYLREQSRRSAEQIVDFQRLAAELIRAGAPSGPD